MSNGEYLNGMGKKLKAARLKNKLSLQKLSNKCGIHLTSLWFIENGRSNVHVLTLKSIADVYGMDIKEFL